MAKKKAKKRPAKPSRVPGKYDPLMEIAVSCTRFFALCDDDTLDLDICCQHLERISHCLHQLDKEQIRELADFVADNLAEARRDRADREYIDFLKTFMQNFNLDEILEGNSTS